MGLHSCCTMLHSRQSRTLPFSTYHHPYLFHLSYSSGMKQYLIIVFDLNSPNDRHFFMCLLTICNLLWRNVYSSPLPVFKSRLLLLLRYVKFCGKSSHGQRVWETLVFFFFHLLKDLQCTCIMLKALGITTVNKVANSVLHSIFHI